MFENLKETSSEAIQTTQEYVEASQKYLSLKAFEQLSLTFSSLIRIIAVGGLTMIAMSFLAIAFAFAAAEWLGSVVYGFLFIAGLFLLFAWIIYLFRNQITDMVIRNLSKQFFNDDDEV